MPSRDQDRAALAYEHVSQFAGETPDQKADAKKYGTMVHKMPALLQTAGLCQALHFIQSRGDDNQKKFLEHLAKQLHRVNGQITSTPTLLERARKADLSEYLQLTDEAMACAAWYRRLVQGVLKVETTDEDGKQ